MSTYSVVLSGGGFGYYSIHATILDTNGGQVAVCTFDCGGIGPSKLSAQGTIDWTSGSPQDFIGQTMSIWCSEYATNVATKFYQGVAPNNVLVGEGTLQLSDAGLGTQGGTGTFQAA